MGGGRERGRNRESSSQRDREKGTEMETFREADWRTNKISRDRETQREGEGGEDEGEGD